MMKLCSVVLAISVLLLGGAAAFADDIDFTSNVSLSQLKTINGDYVSYTGKGGVLGQHIPITEIGTGGRMMAVTGGTCGTSACGWLNFTTGTLRSTSVGQDVFAGGGTLRIVGMVPGDTKNVLLLTATFVGPVTVSEISPGPLGGTLLLSGKIEVASLNKSVLAIFPGLVVPSNGTQMTQIVLRTTMGSNGAFYGKATAESLNTTVPEPSSIALFGGGILGLAGFLRKKRS
jgi:PEP-CTERM motif-containing protein